MTVTETPLKLKLPAIISDNMVLQRELPLPLWGWATPGEAVVVTLGEQRASAIAGPDGRWQVSLGPLAPGGPFDMTVTCGETLTIRNILVGDVWVCSGQSNMEWPLKWANNADEEMAAADFPQIRLFQVPHVAVPEPQPDVQSKWDVCTPETVGDFSAIGYLFGRELHQELGVPIGLINSSWGGSAIEPWISQPGYRTMPEIASVMERFQDGLEHYDELMAEYQQLAAEWGDKVFLKDPGNTGYVQGWAAPDCDIAEWGELHTPGMWQPQGLWFNGAVWFRKEVNIPASWDGSDLSLSFGAIDDFDDTYMNGMWVGGIGRETPQAHEAPRNYTVPAHLVTPGRNMIAVRIFDHYGGGGFVGTPEQMVLHVPGAEPIPLAGIWRYKVEYAVEIGITPPAPRMPMAADNPGAPAYMYNGKIAPLVPFGIRGAIWYQGESNADNARQYRTLFPAMIRDWRTQWGQGDFPFLFVQLANYNMRRPVPTDDSWAELREAQSMTLSEPNTGMAVIIDIGEGADIHPRNKQDVGHRLALPALAKVFDRDIVYSGPMYRSMTVEGNAIRLAFDHVGSGLIARGDTLVGFAIAGADRKFVWAQAKIDGETIVVSHPDVQTPVAVRYAWGQNPACNLYNAEGLSASPFRTDDFPGITA